MAEIIAEPTALSKVIPLKFKINDVDVPKTTQLSTNKQFNTTDTDAWFTFELDGLAATNGTYDLTLINLDDKSIFHHDQVLFPTLPFHYKLNSSEDVTLNEIRHAGRWLGQLVVTLSNGDTTARQFGFDIAGHILDGQDAQVILLSDYQALINTINLAKDDLAQHNVDYAALLIDIAAAEDARVTAYNQLLADQQANIEAFDVALDEGIVAANLATKLQDFEATNNSRLLSAEQQLAESVLINKDIEINAKYPIGTGLPGVVGDGVTDDWQALQNLINYCGENKFKLKIPSITCLVSKPLDGVSGITIVGNGINNTKIKKSVASVNARGVDTVVDFYQKNNFKISGIEIEGNRTNYAEGNTVSTDGLTLLECSYFEIENIRSTSCKRGFYLETNWCCSYSRLTALMCQGYAFTVKNATTSTILSNCTSWGCGGLFDIIGCIYTTIISPACDHSDAGGTVDDPFLPQGSGGNYLNPAYMFNVSSSKITIISPGAENCYSQYMYCEGGDVTLINPYLYNFKNYANTYRFIELRGTGVSNLCITNPNFNGVSNERTVEYTRCGFYIEGPNVQKIKTNKFMKLNDNFGDFEYPSSGIEYIHKTDILNLDQYTMRAGENSFFVYDNVTAANTTIIESDVKKTKFTKLSATPDTDPVEFKVNLPKVGQLFIDLEGYHASSYGFLSCDIIETDGNTTTVLKSFSGNADFTVKSYAYLNSTKKCYLRIKVSHSTDVLKFSKFAITQIM